MDPSGPLATLRKLLLSEESIESLRKFLVKYWYTVILIGIGVLILMVSFESPPAGLSRAQKQLTLDGGGGRRGLGRP